ncbi:MAG: alpha-N-arabinofuranosidase [Clostridiales bacterium]|nr:alpha-N-arabinofuranosidase [Clostridiales bacterium]
MAKITIRPDQSAGTISRYIYGHFSEHLGHCIYGGLFVGKDSSIPNENGIRTDAVQAMRAINLPVLRWPGGCFADEYHWRDGIGPQENRRNMVNTNWGGVTEDNSFGTHEFLELCRQVGCEPYITGNVGSGTAQEMSEWVEYLNSDGDSSVVRERRANGRQDSWGVRFFGVGNESWGCGGIMRPEYYADIYRRYQNFCRQYGNHKLYKIACGPSDVDTNWTEILMKNAAFCMDGLSLHNYTIPGGWDHKNRATEFTEADYWETLAIAADMERKVKMHAEIMDKYDPDKRVGLIVDEWGTWFEVEPGTNPGFLYQQNTMRDAMVAAIHLDLFNRHCDRVFMANIAQVANVLQSIILTKDEEMVLTPTYYVFDLYKHHMDAKELGCDIEAEKAGTETHSLPVITASASEKDGVITLTLSNVSPDKAEEVTVTLDRAVDSAYGRILHGKMDEYNDFGNAPLKVEAFDGFEIRDGKLVIRMPACSVAEIRIRA